MKRILVYCLASIILLSCQKTESDPKIDRLVITDLVDLMGSDVETVKIKLPGLYFASGTEDGGTFLISKIKPSNLDLESSIQIEYYFLDDKLDVVWISDITNDHQMDLCNTFSHFAEETMSVYSNEHLLIQNVLSAQDVSYFNSVTELWDFINENGMSKFNDMATGSAWTVGEYKVSMIYDGDPYDKFHALIAKGPTE